MPGIPLEADLERVCRIADIDLAGRPIVHEINNALTGVLTFAKILERVLTREPFPLERIDFLRDHARLLQEAAERSAALAVAFLRFARKQSLRMEPLDPHVVASRVAWRVANESSVAGLAVEAETGMGQGLVYGSEELLEDAFRQVVENAVEAMPEGGKLTVRPRPDSEPGTVGLVIQDTGCGIPQDIQNAVFEAFVGSGKPRKNGRGLGLGLFFARAVIQQHGGRIWIAETGRGGTRMVIRLPRWDTVEGERKSRRGPRELKQGDSRGLW